LRIPGSQIDVSQLLLATRRKSTRNLYRLALDQRFRLAGVAVPDCGYFAVGQTGQTIVLGGLPCGSAALVEQAFSRASRPLAEYPTQEAVHTPIETTRQVRRDLIVPGMPQQ
jgi:hypothetical protein